MLDLSEQVLRAKGIAALQDIRDAVYASAGLPPRTPELQELLRRRFVASAVAGLLGMADGLRTESDRVAELAAALGTTPRLVVCGEGDDAWLPEHQREMAERLGAPFEVIAGAAHSPNVENPRALLDVLLPAVRSWLGPGVAQG
jgi:pimeloyl-ACP methyl ester carboxylesterase